MSSVVRVMNRMLDEWNGMDAAEAARAILPCNGSRAWAQGMAEARPLGSPEECFAAANRVWRGLGREAWQEAFDSHPRIGESKARAASDASLTWSAGEQAAAKADVDAAEALAEGNREYERKFGRIFIICATGKTAAEILAALRARLGNDAAAEWSEAAEQQRQITQLRLRKWLGVSENARG